MDLDSAIRDQDQRPRPGAAQDRSLADHQALDCEVRPVLVIGAVEHALFDARPGHADAESRTQPRYWRRRGWRGGTGASTWAGVWFAHRSVPSRRMRLVPRRQKLAVANDGTSGVAGVPLTRQPAART